MFYGKNKKEVYDFIVSMGAACFCTTTLRRCGLQDYSYPYDWIGGVDLKGRIEEVINGFPDWFNKEYFVLKGHRTHPEPCDIYLDTKKDLLFVHDFPLNVPIDESFQTVKSRYERRTSRMVEYINNSKKVLLVYMEPIENSGNFYTLEYLSECKKILTDNYKDKEFNIKYFYCTKNEPIYIEKDGIEIFGFNYEPLTPEPLPGDVNFKEIIKRFKNVKLKRKFTFKRLMDFIFSYRVSKRDYTTKITVTILGIKMQKKIKKPLEIKNNG